MTMKYSIDGGLTYQEAPEGVRVVLEDVMVPGEDDGQLHINLTNEGIISDIWVTRDEPLDHNLGTSSQMYDDMMEAMIEENA